MTDYLLLILFTFIAWLIHSGLAALYMHVFDSVQELKFRAFHATEIFITVTITMVIYSITISESISGWTAIGILLTTLLTLDGISLLVVQKLRDTFDSQHFALAYLSAAAATGFITFLFK